MQTYPRHDTGHSSYMRQLLEAPTIVHSLKAEAGMNKRARKRLQPALSPH